MFSVREIPDIGTIILLTSISVLLYILFKRNTSLFTDNDIPGPRPLPIFGNLLMINRMGLKAYKVLFKKYGNVFGVFVGGFPMVIVFDLDIIRQVTVKEFNNFTDRLSFIGKNADVIGKGVFFLDGSDWKRVRRIITPAFSSGKLKLMIEVMNRKAVTLTNNLKVKTDGNDVVVSEIFGAFTTDVIAATAFGLDLDSQTNPNDPFVKMCKMMFKRMQKETPLIMLFLMFPFLSKLLSLFHVSIFPKECLDFFESFGKQLMETRRKSNLNNCCDFFQFLIDAEDTSGSPYSTDHLKKNSLSSEEILGQVLLFFIAGYETTSTLLQFTSYLLATNQEVQEKLAAEVASAELTYEGVTELTYLDRVICESLRMYPPVPQVNRRAAKTININGIQFPKDTIITIPIYHIHHNSDYYPEPEVFKPDRFTAEGKSSMHPLQYLPFGYGPRNCIGMRLALLEAKIALIHVLREVRFEVCTETVVPLEVYNAGTLRPKKPIKLKVVPRN